MAEDAAQNQGVKLKQLLVYALGLLLVGIAGYIAWRDTDLSVLGNVQPWALAALGALTFANLLITAGLFYLVTLPFDAQPRVPMSRMFWLIAASSLLNYLPLRAGLVGRAAYLKAKHALPIHQSVQVLLIVLGLGGVTLGMPLLFVLLFGRLMGQDVACLLAIVVVLLASPAVGSILHWVLKRKAPAAWVWLPLRVMDLLVGAGRMWVAFYALGQPITLAQATLAGAAGMLVSQLGITPNGLGLREWAIGVTIALTAPFETAVGITACLVDRAVEMVIVAVAGGVAMTRLKLQKRADSDSESGEEVV